MLSFAYSSFGGWGSKLLLIIALQLYETPRGLPHTSPFLGLLQLAGLRTRTDGNEELTQNARDEKQHMLHKCSAALIPSGLERS